LRALARRQTLQGELTEQIRNSLELDTILETAVQQIRNLLQINACLFAWYRPEGIGKSTPTASPLSAASSPCWQVVKEAIAPKIPSFLGCYSQEDLGAAGDRLLQMEMVRVDDVLAAANPEMRQFQQKWGIRAIVILPIQTHGGKIGAIVGLQLGEQPRPWFDSEVQLLQGVAGQLAIAIAQAELYSQSQQSAILAREKATALETALEELKQTQAQLIQTEKMSSIGQLVAGVAHEINNPTSFIYGNINPARDYINDLIGILELYQKHYPNPVTEIESEAEEIELEFLVEDLPNLLDSIEIGANRIREIVLSLRNFSRHDEAQMKLVDIHTGIDSTLRLLQNRLKENGGRPGIAIVKCYGDLPEVECYPGQVNQVFMNIFSNAIDAIEDYNKNRSLAEIKAAPCAITITTELRDRLAESGPESLTFAVIRIADNGPGMTESVKNHLFDPFFTTKPIGKGTGLGLAISHSIIQEKHRGNLRCESKLGQGTEFIIEIPLRKI
jgi:signal transduction histidine kinase